MPINIYAIGQTGRLEYEALLCMASLKMFNTRDDINLHVCTPKDGPLWKYDPDMSNGQAADALRALGVNVVQFENELFGSRYPHSNKMYAISALPENEPFIFFDSDHVFGGDLADIEFDFKHPITRQTAMAWPVNNKTPYSRIELWNAVYEKFGIPTEGWFRDTFPESDPRHFPYFNAGVFYGEHAGKFFDTYRHFMHELDQEPPEKLDKWSLYPFLDQVTLPLVMKTLGGSPALYDQNYPLNQISKHYFSVPYLFFQPGNKWLKIAEDVVNKPEYKSIFEENDIFRFYFLEEGHEKVTAFADSLLEKGYFQKGKWPTPATLKKLLTEEDLWKA